MIIIDSPFHITFSDENKKPIYACINNCKSVWWEVDINKKDMNCKKCGKQIEKAIEGIHFKTIKRKKNRCLNIKDFIEYFPNLTKKEQNLLKSTIENKLKIGILSIVKPKFIEKAKKEWC